MGGFRKAMPFTFVDLHDRRARARGVPVHVGLLLEGRGAGLHDQPRRRLRGAGDRGLLRRRAHRRSTPSGWSSGCSAASRCRRRGSSRAVTLAHGEPMNPLTGEPEDTDVGFPGPEHNVAERSLPMKVAMAPLALLALVAGVVGIPGVTDTLEHFLEPTFEDSRYIDDHPSDGGRVGRARRRRDHLGRVDLRRLRLLSCAGAASRSSCATATRGSTRSSSTSGTSTSSMTPCSCGRRPPPGAFGRRVVETDFVQGFIVGGATGIVRGGHLVRARDPDRLPARLRPAAAARRGRARPLLPDRELMTIHLSIVLFLPLATGLLGRGPAARHGALGRAGRHGGGARLRDRDARRLRLGGRAPVRDGRRVDRGARDPLPARGRRAQPVHGAAHGDRLGAVHARGRPCASTSGPSSSSSTWRSPRPRCWARSWRRTSRSSSSSST